MTFDRVPLETCCEYVIKIFIQQVFYQISNTSKCCHKTMNFVLVKVNDGKFDHVSTQSVIRKRNSALASCLAAFPIFPDELKRYLALQLITTL